MKGGGILVRKQSHSDVPASPVPKTLICQVPDITVSELGSNTPISLGRKAGLEVSNPRNTTLDHAGAAK